MASSLPSQNNIVQNSESQINFNPSWMQSTVPPVQRSLNVSNNNNANMNKIMTLESEETCDPIFAKNSYGREDLLAMMGKDTLQPPAGIERYPFFVDKPLIPIILLSLTEIEMRLQQNVNSSKALSAFNRSQSASGVSGTVDGLTPNDNSGGWTVAGTSRSGTTNVEKHQAQFSKKYHSHGSGSDKNATVPSRWSALSTAGTGPPQRQAWKNGAMNNSGNGAVSGFERNNMRGSDKGNNFHISTLEDGDSEASEKEPQQLEMSTKKSNRTPSETIIPTGRRDIADCKMTRQNPSESSSFESNKLQKLQQQNQHQAESAIARLENENASKPLQSPPKSQQIVVQQVLQVEKWHYLDPNGVERGPFDSQQMQAWFTSGYFTSSLQVRRVGDSDFITLGHLFHISGEQTPFASKAQRPKVVSLQPEEAMPAATIGILGQNAHQRISPSDLLDSAPPLATSLISPSLADVERIWATTPLEDAVKNTASSSSTPFGTTGTGVKNGNVVGSASAITASGFTHSAFSTHLKEFELEKMLQSKEMQIMEEQRKLREKEELLRRDETERIEKERLMHEMETDLKRKQEELKRIAREKDQEFEQRCLQMAEYERKRREELAALEARIRTEHQQQQLRREEEDRRRANELEEVLRREQERQRQLLEAEAKRKREEEEARIRLALQEAQHMRELALEQARRAEEEQRRRLIEEQQRQQQKALEEARAERTKQQETAAKAEAAAKLEQLRISSNTWQQPATNNEPPISSVQQVLPDSNQHFAQMRASAWQSIPQAKPIPLNIPIHSQKQQMQSQRQQTRQQSAATVVTEQQRKGWQQVAVPKPSPIPPVINKTGGTGASAKTPAQGQQKQNGSKQQQQKQMSAVEDKFMAWIIGRVQELNPSVDAEVFATFISEIDSPNEAEDYIVGYLGEKKEVKEFHRDFLKKRIEMRPRVNKSQKDDLSGPAAALGADSEAKGIGGVASSGGGSGHPHKANGGGTNAKKKKQKVVLDPSSLGFRPASDPNRLNAGEIDTILPPVTAVNNRKR